MDGNQQAQTGDQGAAGQGQTTNNQPQNQGGQPAQTPKEPQDVQGLKSALTAEREKRQAKEAELKRANEQLFLYSMNRINAPNAPQPQPQAQAAEPQGKPAAKVSIPEDLAKMDDNEMISAGELKKFMAGMSFQGGPAAGAPNDDKTQAVVGEHLLTLIKPDAEKVISGNFAQRLQQATPWERQQMVDTINNAPAMLKPFIAYKLGQGYTPKQAQEGAVQDMAAVNMNPASQNVATPDGNTPPANVTRIMQNAGQPTPTSVVANSGAINTIDRFKNMTDAEIDAEAERVKMG